jgi:hypothetical protein
MHNLKKLEIIFTVLVKEKSYKQHIIFKILTKAPIDKKKSVQYNIAKLAVNDRDC